MADEPRPLTGRCLCGAVRFEATPPLRAVSFCHCRQCARWSGHVVAATAVKPERFRLTAGEAALTWYRSSAEAERGFCSRCGSSLFWRPSDGSRISIMAGSLEPPTGLSGAHHIFAAEKSDYYDIDDGLPRHAGWAGTSDPP